MAAVEGDDQVVVGEVRVGELAGAVPGAVVAAALQRLEGALIGALADVPVAGARAASRPRGRASPAASANQRNTTSAIGERQMLPVQTKTTRNGSSALAVMLSILTPRCGSCTPRRLASSSSPAVAAPRQRPRAEAGEDLWRMSPACRAIPPRSPSLDRRCTRRQLQMERSSGCA